MLHDEACTFLVSPKTMADNDAIEDASLSPSATALDSDNSAAAESSETRAGQKNLRRELAKEGNTDCEYCVADNGVCQLAAEESYRTMVGDRCDNAHYAAMPHATEPQIAMSRP